MLKKILRIFGFQTPRPRSVPEIWTAFVAGNFGVRDIGHFLTAEQAVEFVKYHEYWRRFVPKEDWWRVV